MDIRGYVRALRRNLVLILLCVVGVMAAVYGVSDRAVPMYESQVRVIVTSAQVSTASAVDGAVLSNYKASTYAEVVMSELLASKVRVALELDPEFEEPLEVGDLVDQVSASSIDESSVVEIKVLDRDPAVAQAIAAEYATQVVDTAAEIETPQVGGDPLVKVTVIDFASFDDNPVSPQTVRNVILGFVLGLVLGLGIAVLRELLNTTISSEADLAQATTVPVLGTIGHEGPSKRRQLITDLEQHAHRVEAFRMLRTNVQFLDVDSQHEVFVITSSTKQEGKTSTAVSLALTLARAGVKTLLIDGDLRRPRVAETFGIDGSVGVTTILLGKVGLDEAIWRHDETGLDLLPSGVVPPNAAELIQTRAMAALLEHVRKEYDVVLIDSPPLLPVTDAALLAARADGVLLVVRHGRTKRDQVVLAQERLAQVEVTPAGIVLNDVPVRGSSYGYRGSYTSYAPEKQRKNHRRREKHQNPEAEQKSEKRAARQART